jgi:hypothetical protein
VNVLQDIIASAFQTKTLSLLVTNISFLSGHVMMVHGGAFVSKSFNDYTNVPNCSFKLLRSFG